MAHCAGTRMAPSAREPSDAPCQSEPPLLRRPKWSAMAPPGVGLAALERAQLFGSDIQAPHSPAAQRFRATGGRTGELHEDWQGAFVVKYIDRAGRR